jgi:hypothetical protein
MSKFNLPFEVHLPGYNYCGPGTKLKQRLARGDKPVNRVDAICQQHDIDYSNSSNSDDIRAADIKMIEKLDTLENPSWRERAGRFMTKTGIKTKMFFGQGLLYCLKCKNKTETKNTTEKTLRNGKRVMQGLCTVCGSKKNRFLAQSSPRQS